MSRMFKVNIEFPIGFGLEERLVRIEAVYDPGARPTYKHDGWPPQFEVEKAEIITYHGRQPVKIADAPNWVVELVYDDYDAGGPIYSEVLANVEGQIEDDVCARETAAEMRAEK